MAKIAHSPPNDPKPPRSTRCDTPSHARNSQFRSFWYISQPHTSREQIASSSLLSSLRAHNSHNPTPQATQSPLAYSSHEPTPQVTQSPLAHSSHDSVHLTLHTVYVLPRKTKHNFLEIWNVLKQFLINFAISHAIINWIFLDVKFTKFLVWRCITNTIIWKWKMSQ